MRSFIKIFLLLLFFVFCNTLQTGCSSTGKTRKAKKRIIHVDNSKLGKNKVFYSKSYQKKLKKRRRK
jgi:hypothetical protein